MYSRLKFHSHSFRETVMKSTGNKHPSGASIWAKKKRTTKVKYYLKSKSSCFYVLAIVRVVLFKVCCERN